VESGFHGPKVARFQILVSNVFFVLCFPNEMTLITGLLLKGKNERSLFFFYQKSSLDSMKNYKYNLYSIKSEKIRFFALPVKTVNTSVL